MWIAAVIAFLLLPLLVVAVKGDPLYVGLWYYLVLPLAVVGGAALARPGRWFLVGVAAAVSLSLLAYQWIQLTRARPEGLLVLGHLFSLPGAFIGGLGVAIIARLRGWKGSLRLFWIGLGTAAAGFMIAQTIICNTLMYCGMLSF